MTKRQHKHELLVTYEMYLRIAKKVREKKMQPAGRAPIGQRMRRTLMGR